MTNRRMSAAAIAAAMLLCSGSALATERPTGDSNLQRKDVHGSPVQFEPSIGMMSRAVASDRLGRKGYHSDTLVLVGHVWEMKDAKTGKQHHIDAFTGAIDGQSGVAPGTKP